MRQLNSVLGKTLLIIASFSSFTANIFAESITVEYLFESPQIHTVTLEGEEYQRVTMSDASNFGNAGHPGLPARGAKILLPPNATVSSIEIIRPEKELIGQNLVIEPMPRPVPFSVDQGMVNPPTPDPAIYSMDGAFPKKMYAQIGIQSFRGYQILTLRLQPVKYHPKSGDLYYYPRMTVKVTLTEREKSSSLFRGSAQDEKDIMTKVDNPEQVMNYPTAIKSGVDDFDMLIITDPILEDAFQPLKDYHDTTGTITEIHTTADIGSDDPASVRDYIRDIYSNNGIQYVLLAGDVEILPPRHLSVWTYFPTGGESRRLIGELYFGCLDGSYNSDGDDRWGETHDGEDGGIVDLVAEVYVGRASVSDGVEATRFVNKTIAYLTDNNFNYLNSVLSCGEDRNIVAQDPDYSAMAMEQMVDGSSGDGYVTVGIPSDKYNIDRLYDRDFSENWPPIQIINRINSGLHFINHMGHGMYDWALRLYIDDVMTELTKSIFLPIYSGLRHWYY
jgi:hypothetical protein